MGKGPPQSPTCRVAVYLHVFIRTVSFGAPPCHNVSQVNVWQKPLKHCKVISLQLMKINEKKKKDNSLLKQVKIKIMENRKKKDIW